jgi:Sulfotransferase domain
MKEPHYFSRIEPAPDRRAFFPHVSDEASYLALFDGAAGEGYVGEASTSYLWEPHTAERINASIPDARILVMLRDPVERAHSQYWNDVREGLESRGFLEALVDERRSGPGAWGVTSLYIECGLYADQLERYLERFGSQVHVAFFEDYARGDGTATAEILSFLGIEPEAADAVSGRANPASMPRNRLGRALLGSGRARTIARATVPRGLRGRLRRALLKRSTRPPMDPEARALLTEAFGSEAARLDALLGRRPPWAP